MINFDIHVNLRSFPGSSKGKQQRDITPEEMSEYFKTHGITHSLVLYNRDDYKELEKLSRLTSTKVYGVQCMMGPTKESPTDLNNLPELDVNIEGRSFLSGGHCYGIKLASNRGWWKIEDKVTSGIDYLHPVVKQLLDKLPDNSIVSMHTQGSTVINPKRNDGPKTILNYGIKYKKLKFIINHCGDYGPALRVARPGIKGDFWKYDGESFKRYINHRATVLESLTYCEFGHNIFGDMSCFTYGKGEIVSHNNYSMWCIGSDFPFSENLPVNYTTERDNFLKWTNYIPDEEAVKFFESTHEELVEWCHQRNIQVKERNKQHKLNIKNL